MIPHRRTKSTQKSARMAGLSWADGYVVLPPMVLVLPREHVLLAREHVSNDRLPVKRIGNTSAGRLDNLGRSVENDKEEAAL